MRQRLSRATGVIRRGGLEPEPVLPLRCLAPTSTVGGRAGIRGRVRARVRDRARLRVRIGDRVRLRVRIRVRVYRIFSSQNLSNGRVEESSAVARPTLFQAMHATLRPSAAGQVQYHSSSSRTPPSAAGCCSFCCSASAGPPAVMVNRQPRLTGPQPWGVMLAHAPHLAAEDPQINRCSQQYH